jgi:hypothetical protein
LIFSIKDLNDIQVFSDRVAKIEPSVEQIVITLEEEAKDLRNEMESAFYEAGIGAWYFIAFYDLFTYRINAKEI